MTLKCSADICWALGERGVYFLKVRPFVRRNFAADEIGEQIGSRRLSFPPPSLKCPAPSLRPCFHPGLRLSAVHFPKHLLRLFVLHPSACFLSLFLWNRCRSRRHAGDLWPTLSGLLSGAGTALGAAACAWMTMENQSHYALQPRPSFSGHCRLHLAPWFMDAILAPERDMKGSLEV